MALPLLFTACSQDELVSGGDNNATLGNRKTVENVTINMNEPETRMVFGNGYEWENGDRFGACLMDVYDDKNVNGSWWEDFTLVNYIQTNYPFTRQEGGNWTSEAVMQEGNYFFYFPYNYNLGGMRTPIRLAVPTEQVVADGEPASSVLNNQLFIGYNRIVAEEGKESESISLTMQPLLAFPGFNLKNVGTGSLTIYRIAFAADEYWPTELEVKPAVGGFVNFEFEEMTETQQREELLKIVSQVTETKTERVTLAFGESGIELSSQEDVWAYIMLPEAKNLSNPKLYIYTNLGLGTVDLSVEHKDGGKTNGVTNITNDRPLTSIVYNDGAGVYITFDNTSVAQPSEMNVTTTSDLEDLVSWSRNSTQATLTATVTGDKVEISKEIYDMLNANDNLVLNIKCKNAGDATVTIPADAPANALNRVNFSNVNIVNKAEVTLSGAIGANKLTNEGAITYTGNDYTANNTTVVNNGTITFQAVNTRVATTIAMGNTNSNFTNTNKGTVIVATDVNITSGGITNNGIMTINEGVELNGRITNGAFQSKDGVLNVAGDWTVKFNAGANYGVINVAETGSITIPANCTFTNNENIVKNQKGEVVFEGMINNSGIIRGITNDKNAIVKMVVETARLETATGSQGLIDNTIGSNYVTKQSAETIYCVVTEPINASDLGALVKDANANRLDISGTITIDPAENATDVTVEIAQVNVEGNLKIDGAEKTLRFVNGTSGTTLNINAGTTELTSRSVLSLGALNKCDGTLNLNSDATFIIANGARLYANKGTNGDDVEKYGTWYYLNSGVWEQY